MYKILHRIKVYYHLIAPNFCLRGKEIRWMLLTTFCWSLISCSVTHKPTQMIWPNMLLFLKGTGHSKLEILSSVLVTIDFHCMGEKVIETGMKSMPVRSNKKCFVDPKKVKSPCCMWLYHECGGWPQRKGKERRERKRERPPAYSLADLKCVLSRAIFSWGNGQKSCRNTADKRTKLYTLICHYNMADCLLNEDDSIRPSFSLSFISLSPFCLSCTERQLHVMLHLLCQCSWLNAALHMPCGRQYMSMKNRCYNI